MQAQSQPCRIRKVTRIADATALAPRLPINAIARRPLHRLLPACSDFPVLMERRVVLVSSQLRLPTLAAEALLQLLWPIRWAHHARGIAVQLGPIATL